MMYSTMLIQRALAICAVATSLLAADPEVVLLWPNGAPGSEGKAEEESVRLAGAANNERVVTRVHKPSLTVYLPAPGNATGAAVIVAPGGGHRELWSDHEGHNVARWLSEHGVAGFVLKYRLAREQGSTYSIEGHALADAHRAIRVVRSRAKAWGLHPGRIGIMGFSAGGEVAALAASRAPESGPSSDPIDKENATPSFQALVYPAIPKSMALAKETPPAFLLCGENDRQNISQGLPELYLSMKKAGMSAELHVLARVGHGFGVRPTNQGAAGNWLHTFREWMRVSGFIQP